MRSYLFVPGHNERLLASAKKSDADCLILDLEDSVPEGYKDKARELIREFTCDKPVYVRVNAGFDLAYVNDSHGIMIPRATAKEVKKYSYSGLDLIPLIETTRGVFEAYKICRMDGLVSVAFGGEDFKADLQGTDIHTARSMVVMAARAAGIEPIDTAYIDIHNDDGFNQHVATSKSMGYRSMLCLHPKQIPVIHEYFTPSAEEIAHAKETIRLSEQSAKEGRGVAIIDGQFVGPPMVRMAKKILKI